MPPTASLSKPTRSTFTVNGGKITGHAATRNDLLMLSQLGLLPAIKALSETAWRTQLTPDSGHPPEGSGG